MSTYILDQTWELEAERLRYLEEWCDPMTTDHLATIGAGPGWRCLEVGAGRGSIASWLAERVSPDGSVLAIDLDLTLLEQHRRTNLEVQKMDLFSESFPRDEFDLVHARHVVGHLGERRLEAVRILAAALKPGGILVIEDLDMIWNQIGEWPCSDPELAHLILKAWVGLAQVFHIGNYDSQWGRRIGPAMVEAGLVEVHGEARASIGGAVGAHLTRLPMLRFREPLLDMGALTTAEFDRLVELTTDFNDDTVLISPLLASVWGRRPG